MEDEYLDRYTQLCLQSERLRQRLSVRQSQSRTFFLEGCRSSMVEPMQAYSFPVTQNLPAVHALPQTWVFSESEQVDEADLYETNRQIKRLLTELLNCNSVRSDKLARAWVQARLMDIEHELTRQRRRRSSAIQKALQAISSMNGVSRVPPCRSSI